MPPIAAAVLASVLAFSLDSALASYQARKFAEAEAALRRTLAAQPKNLEARLYLARTLVELGRGSEAAGELEKLLSGQPSDEIRFEAGRVLRQLAERRFAQLEALAPNSAATLELAGARFEWTGNLDEALKHYRAAAELNPNRPGVHYRVGNVLWRKRELEAAAAALQKELALTPHHGLANLRMGEILLSSDRAEPALTFLQRAVTAMPDAIEARRELGKAYRRLGRLAEARVEWEHVAKRRPEDDQIHYLLGTLHREMGEPELAKRELEIHRGILERRRQQSEER